MFNLKKAIGALISICMTMQMAHATGVRALNNSCGCLCVEVDTVPKGNQIGLKCTGPFGTVTASKQGGDTIVTRKFWIYSVASCDDAGPGNLLDSKVLSRNLMGNKTYNYLVTTNRAHLSKNNLMEMVFKALPNSDTDGKMSKMLAAKKAASEAANACTWQAN